MGRLLLSGSGVYVHSNAMLTEEACTSQHHRMTLEKD